MLVAQLSDPHINPQRPHKAEALRRAVRHLLELPRHPGAVLVTGDCTDNGTREEYAEFRALVQPLPVPVYIIPGNHDDRDVMLEEFGEQGTSSLPGFVQYVVEDGPLRLIALDTHVPGESGGMLDSPRLRWLSDRLEEAPRRPTLIFMHHPPVVAGLNVMDSIGLGGSEAFREVVARHGQVERIVAGHTHITMTGRFAGTLVMTCPGTDNALLPDLTQPEKLVVQLQPPLCLLHAWDDQTGFLTYTSIIAPSPRVTLHDGERWV
ncbi:phosphodiesterase [Deinococcus aestuarii]|uniref:phosphodiesterase n=1 Tax=Deinococcus aestuarii TaxID=2774531 RepID=UPI001C0B927F|nr:phosphodiesterase [Deinococcus aestuarii]